MKLYQTTKNTMHKSCSWCGFFFEAKSRIQYCTAECRTSAKREMDRCDKAAKRLLKKLQDGLITHREFTIQSMHTMYMPPVFRFDFEREEAKQFKTKAARKIHFYIGIMKLLIETWMARGKAPHDPNSSPSGRNA